MIQSIRSHQPPTSHPCFLLQNRATGVMGTALVKGQHDTTYKNARKCPWEVQTMGKSWEHDGNYGKKTWENHQKWRIFMGNHGKNYGTSWGKPLEILAFDGKHDGKIRQKLVLNRKKMISWKYEWEMNGKTSENDQEW